MAPVAGETVLLVEDNTQVRNVTALRLKNLGYQVIEAENAPAAIDVLRSGKAVDLVFSDVVMPGGMSGFGLARWIREHMPAVRILLTSGSPRTSPDRAKRPRSIWKCCASPTPARELARAVRRALDGKG